MVLHGEPCGKEVVAEAAVKRPGQLSLSIAAWSFFVCVKHGVQRHDLTLSTDKLKCELQTHNRYLEAMRFNPRGKYLHGSCDSLVGYSPGDARVIKGARRFDPQQG